MSEPTLITVVSGEVARTLAVGRAIAAAARPGDVIALSGQLGAGKTQFVRGLVSGLGADERAVSSPTFVLMQEYDADVPVLHIDAYRLQSLDEVETIGWTDALREQSVTVIEWADRIRAELPDDRLDIHIEHLGDQERELTLCLRGDWMDRAASLRELDRPAGAELSDVACPICGQSASAAWRPFCSDRCRMVDLNRWLNGDYRITRDVDWHNDDVDRLPRSGSPD